MTSDIASESDDPRPVIDDLVTYNRVFKPKRAIARSPTRVTSTTTRTVGQQQVSATQSLSSVRPPQKLFPSKEGEDVEEDDGPFSPPPTAAANGELFKIFISWDNNFFLASFISTDKY